MIRTPALLVVGAGGSCPFGFPLGRELVTAILQLAPLNDPERIGHPRPEIDAFATALRRSGQGSIDAFLERRPEFAEIGKHAIARTLLPHENPSRLYDRTFPQPWYEYLFQRLAAAPDRFHENQLKVITFNYDRSLEFYLRTAFADTYHCTETDAGTFLEAVPVLHMHGQLGSLDEIPYGGAAPVLNNMRKAASGIRVVHEGDEFSDEVRSVRQWMLAARHIYFVGFSFHPANVDRLRPPVEDRCHAALGVFLRPRLRPARARDRIEAVRSRHHLPRPAAR